ncbi:hypothetical protein [Nostoc sp. MS1]|nr:hypothetical protein [Nostoc sp. MS1]
MQQIKQADLEMLELSAAAGEIDLKYMDESGFNKKKTLIQSAKGRRLR